jgi:hypothetical protein
VVPDVVCFMLGRAYKNKLWLVKVRRGTHIFKVNPAGSLPLKGVEISTR